MWLIAVITFLVGLAIGLTVLMIYRSKIQTEKEQLQIKVATIETQQQFDLEKLDWVENARTQMSDTFKALASESLRANSEQISNRTKSEFETLVNPLKENLKTLDGYVRDLEKKREGAYTQLGEQLKQLGTMHTTLQNTTTTLAQALKSPTVRGRWGEVQLHRLVEMTGMAQHVDFAEQYGTDAGRPDMIVHLPQGAILPIDSKVPLEAYLEASEATDDQVRAAKMDQHMKALRSRIRDLAQKSYWEQFPKTPEMVVMFIPVEASIGAAFQRDPDLFDYAMQNKVIITSPINLLALLKVIAYGWQQQQITENAEQIQQEGQMLYKRIMSFVKHFNDVGKSLDKSVKGYNQAVGSLEGRLIPSARRFQEMGVGTSEVEHPKQIDTQPRVMIDTSEDEINP